MLNGTETEEHSLGGAVVANRLDGAFFLRLFAEFFLFRGSRLLKHERVAFVFVGLEVVRSGSSAEIAVDAFVIDVPLACDITFDLVCGICHLRPPADSSLFSLLVSAFPLEFAAGKGLRRGNDSARPDNIENRILN